MKMITSQWIRTIEYESVAIFAETSCYQGMGRKYPDGRVGIHV